MVWCTMAAAVSTDLATQPTEEEEGQTHILLFLNLIFSLLLSSSKKRHMWEQESGGVGFGRMFTTMTLSEIDGGG